MAGIFWRADLKPRSQILFVSSFGLVLVCQRATKGVKLAAGPKYRGPFMLKAYSNGQHHRPASMLAGKFCYRRVWCWIVWDCNVLFRLPAALGALGGSPVGLVDRLQMNTKPIRPACRKRF